MSALDPTGARRQEIADALGGVQERIAAACSAAGRPREEVTLVAVTKYFPASDAAALVRLGVQDLGESRDPEAGEKAAALGEVPGLASPTWHFVGQLQTNKANRVARYADVVHSVDRDRLVRALSHGAELAGRTLGVLVQVNLGGPDADRRGGVEPDAVAALADAVAASPGLVLRGLMAVAPRGQDPAPAFERLARTGERLRADHPGASWLSAGMSGDLEAAVAHGATHLRIGSAILGARPAAG